ncbi:hypothetical protein [Pedobacter miscanthi]|uniref:Uncharacterized protein n=1 Tax=Pedobacter miscanthi TaxID=2259170 RepID=A0A366KNV5_9SPHI|nr:hypothetical protein [Pedobacter miscanthi]RBQ03351.1 hypothetical protein DRW42_22515 [Pedobacter miscanthi]
MKKIVLAFLLLMGGLSVQAQTYQPVTSKNKTYLETVKGLSYTYKNGIITLKNNGKYNLGTVSIIASSKTDADLFGIALFEDGLEKGQTVQATVYFTTGKDNHEIPLKTIDQNSLIFSFDKAVRAVN